MRTRDAYGLGIALMLAAGVHAQGFAPLRMSDPGDTCYSWEGGYKTAGSYSKCQPTIVIAAAPAPPPAPQIAPSPIMMPMSCPPLPAPHHKPIVKRKPRVQC